MFEKNVTEGTWLVSVLWEKLDCDGKSTGQRIKVLSFSPSPETKGNIFEHECLL